jgi:hypothetical protein
MLRPRIPVAFSKVRTTRERKKKGQGKGFKDALYNAHGHHLVKLLHTGHNVLAGRVETKLVVLVRVDFIQITHSQGLRSLPEEHAENIRLHGETAARMRDKKQMRLGSARNSHCRIQVGNTTSNLVHQFYLRGGLRQMDAAPLLLVGQNPLEGVKAVHVAAHAPAATIARETAHPGAIKTHQILAKYPSAHTSASKLSVGACIASYLEPFRQEISLWPFCDPLHNLVFASTFRFSPAESVAASTWEYAKQRLRTNCRAGCLLGQHEFIGKDDDHHSAILKTKTLVLFGISLSFLQTYFFPRCTREITR